MSRGPLDVFLSGMQSGMQIEGDDDEDFTGGVQIGARRSRGEPQQNMGMSAQVRQTPGALQYLIAGIPRQSVAAAASADLQVTTSETFRPDRLILSVAAQALDVTNIKIGTKTINVTSNPISGNCFSEQAVGSVIRGWTAQSGVGFLISVTNNTVAAITSGGGVFGPAVV